MNKTVTINISGIIFHIEEDAYEKLSKYLSTIKGYFSSTDGGSEIMSDIEARIAEMLQGKTSAVKQVVLMNDVDAVIEAMGKPEEFAGDSEQSSSNSSQSNSNTETNYGEPVKKRLFRDPDNKAIGGVCSGIAAYFDIDIVWIRLAMFLLIFFGGLSLWVYIILWIVIPEAKTVADKLAMRGEKIDINNISRSVKEEAEQLKKRMEKYGNDFKSGAYNQQSQNFFDKLGNFLKDLIIFVTKFFARVLGLILLIFGVCFMLGLLSSVLGFSIVGANTEFNDWVNLFFMERSHYTLGMMGIALFFGVPFLMMIYGGIKLLFKIHYSNRWLNITAGCIWLVGFIIALFVGIKTGKNFSEGGRVKENITLTTTSDTLYLSVKKSKELISAMNLMDTDEDEYDETDSHMNVRTHHNDYVVAKKNGTRFIVGHASMNILPAAGDKFELYIVKKSRGEDKRSATERAKNIEYNITQYDSSLVFDELFVVNEKEKFRVQEIEVILKVPRGKVVSLDKSLAGFIYDVENVTNTWDGDMVGRRWIMTKDGLACVDCEGLEKDFDEEHLRDLHGLPAPPAPPAAPNTTSAPINVDSKDANVKIDKDGIKINSKDANVKVDKNGIHIDTKETKGDK